MVKNVETQSQMTCIYVASFFLPRFSPLDLICTKVQKIDKTT